MIVSNNPEFSAFALERMIVDGNEQTQAFNVVRGTKTIGTFVGGVFYPRENRDEFKCGLLVGYNLMRFLCEQYEIENERIERERYSK